MCGDAEAVIRQPLILSWRVVQFLQMFRQQLAQAGKPRIADQIHSREIERARDVLDVHGVLARRGLEAERAERLEVALQRHQIKAPPELLRITWRRQPAVAQREKEGD